jgi:hypothetical protein
MRITGAIAFCLLLMAAGPASAQDFLNLNLNDFKWELGTGLDYSTGKYGASADTQVLSVPLDVKLQLDRVRLEVSVPYERVQGPGTYAGGVIVDSGAISTRSGLGDVTTGAYVLVNKDSSYLPAIELGGQVKIPTAASGIGTGKADYSALANFYHSFTPRFMLFGSAGYQWLSDFGPYHLKDGVLASIGTNFKADQDTSFGFTVNYRQAYYDGLGDQFSASPYAFWNFEKNWRLVGYGTVGMTKASPRLGAGFRIVFFK